MLEKLSLEGKVALVTGGGRGLGRLIAHAMAQAGADIAICARTVSQLEQTAGEVRAMGRRAMYVPMDFTKSDQVEATVERVLGEYGRIDILVNNAGVVSSDGGEKLGFDPELETILGVTDDYYRLGMDTDLTGGVYFSRAVGRHLVERRRGRVINMTSPWGLRAARGRLVYGVAKAGVVHLTKVLAMSWAPYGISVNCIAPLAPQGIALTKIAEVYKGMGSRDAESRQKLIPMGIGKGPEVARLAVFLASDACEYVNGQIISVDGGADAGGYAPTSYVLNVSSERVSEGRTA